MNNADRGNRPLSPHLSIYRPQLTSITSILIRITGNALIVCVFLIVWWLFSAATSPQYFEVVDGIINSWFGTLILISSLGRLVSSLGWFAAFNLGQSNWFRFEDR